MSNLDPPIDPLMTWVEYGKVRIGNLICEPRYVLATLTRGQAFELVVSLTATLRTRDEAPVCPACSRGGGSPGDRPRRCVRLEGHDGHHVALDDGENIPTVWTS